MRKWLNKKQQGFTLIELMIVVAIIGILSVLAIYGVRKYLANAKTAEAKNSLGHDRHSHRRRYVNVDASVLRHIDVGSDFGRNYQGTKIPVGGGGLEVGERYCGLGVPQVLDGGAAVLHVLVRAG